MAIFCISSIQPELKARILSEARLPQMSDRNLGSLIGTTCIKLGIDKADYEKYIDIIIPELNISEYEESITYDNKTAINTYNILKKEADSGKFNAPKIKEFNKQHGTNFGVNPNTGEITSKSPKLYGISIYNPNDTKVVAKKRIDRALLLDYLGSKFNLNFKELSKEAYNKKFGKYSNCSVEENTVYIRKGDLSRLTNEQLIEEFLHPAVHAIYVSNPELSIKLLTEAEKSFPNLVGQIRKLYYGNHIQNEEIITQILSKYLNKEISDNGINSKSLVDYIKQFITNIIDGFKDLFGNVNIQKDTRLTISGKDIKDALSFENLAELINTKEVSFKDVLGKNRFRNNKTTKSDNNTLKQARLERNLKAWEELREGLTRKVFKSKNFKKDHTYYVIQNGKRIKVKDSITEINRKLHEDKPYNGPDTPAAKIGNTFDAFIRDYFSEEGLKKSYPNLSDSQYEALKKQIESTLIPQFNSLFGGKGNYKVLTKFKDVNNNDELTVAGTLSINGEDTLTAGTVDMIIVTSDGWYLYDMKTTRNTMNNSIESKYKGQVTAYHNFIVKEAKEAGIDLGEFKGYGLIVAKTSYPTDNGRYSGYDNLEDTTTDQVLYNGKPIQEAVGYGINLLPIKTIETDEKMDSLIYTAIQSSETEEEAAEKVDEEVAKEEEATDTQEESDAEEIAAKNKQRIKAQIETYSTETLRPISAREELIIGRNAMKMAVYIANKIVSDKTGSWEYKIFGTKGSLNQLTVDGLIRTEGKLNKILEFIKEDAFGDTEDITDDLTSEKAQYIYDNWQAIINRGYNTLLRIAKVGLASDNSIEKTINEDEAMFEAFQIGERELNDNESYDIDKKEIDFQESIPTELKSRFYTIPKPQKDEDGVIIRRPDGRSSSSYQLGLVDFYDGEKVIQSIASLVHSCSTVSQMISLMEQNQGKYPYFEYVLDILKDSNLKDKFFRTFRKNLTVYTTSVRKKGRMVQQTLNKAAKKDYIMQSLRSRLLSVDDKTTPSMFHRDKNAPLGVLSINKKALISLISIIPDSKDRSNLISALNSSRTGVKNLISILKSIGIDTIDDPSALVGEDDTIKKIKGALESIYKELNAITGKSSLLENTKVMKAYSSLASFLINAVGDRANTTQYNAGKNYQTFTQPTFIQDTIEELAGKKYKTTVDGKVEVLTAEELLSDTNSRYLRYRQFSYLGDGGQRKFVNSWLEKLSEKDSKASKLIRYWSGTTVNKKKLFKQTLADYTLDTLVHYFSPDVYTDYRPDEIAAFRVPNYADKNAVGYIVFEKELPKKGETFEDAITNRASEYFLYELQRMRAVMQQARDPKLASKDVANFHLDRKKAAAIIDKIQRGESITRADLVEGGKLRDYIANSGLSFKFVSEINSALTDSNSKLGDEIIKVLNDTKYQGLSTRTVSSLLSKFKDYFKAKMKEEELASTATIKSYLGEKGLKRLGLAKDADVKLGEFFWQNWLAANNIYNLMVGDLAYYKDVTDVQKRFAEVNAGTEKVNIESTFTTPTSSDPKRVSDGKMRVVVIKTEKLSGDDISKRVETILKNRVKELSKTNKKASAKLYSQIDSIVKGFKGIDATDGQGFATPTGFWKKMKMLGEMNPEFERAFDRIRKGDFSIGDVDLCVETLKPFGYGFVEKHGNTLLGDELIPFQIKDSEAMIFLAGAILSNGGENGGPLAAIYKAIEDSHYSSKEHNLDTYVPNGIDVIVFDSGIKSGNYGIVDLNGLSYDQIISRLNNLSVDEIKEFPFDNWGKQQNTPAHMQDHEQAMSSQNRILVVADFVDGDTIAGRPAKQVIKDYFDLIDEDLREGLDIALRKLGCYLDNNGMLVTGPDFQKKLAEKVRNKAANDKRYSPEVVNALSIFDANGNPIIPFGDPAMTKAVMSTIFSAFKNNVNKEKMQGGPAVLTTGFGLNLKIGGLDDNLNEGVDDKGIYYEAIIVPPTKTIEKKVTYNAKRAKQNGYKLSGTYRNGDILSMKDIDSNHILSEQEKEFLLTFIPCEDKYSMVRCKVKEFMPRFAGEVQRVSKAITAITGKDFDIDKGYDEFFFDTDGLSRKIEDLKVKLKKETRKDAKKKLKKALAKQERTLTTWERKNKILRIKMDALGSLQAIEKLLSTGEFTELEDLAEKVDPTFKTGLGSLAIFYNAMAMHNRNAAGKEYVGIAALNNVSHAIANIADVAFKMPDWTFKINNISVGDLFKDGKFQVDPTYNMEGARISGILRQFVGAAADNGKKPTLGSLNTNPITANMAMGLIRMGFPLKTVIYMLNNPVIKEITRLCGTEGGRFEQYLNSFAALYLKDFTNSAFNKTNFSDDELYDRVNKPFSEESISDVDKSVLYFFHKMAPYCQAISDLNQFTSLNSLQNAAGPTEFDERVKYLKMNNILNRAEQDDSLWEKGTFDKLFDKIPFLHPLFDIYESYIPAIAKSISPVYSEQFTDIMSSMQQWGLDFSSIDMDFIKVMRGVIDAFEVYRATNLFLKTDSASRKNTLFNFPITLNEKKSLGLRNTTFMQAVNVGAISKAYPILGAYSDVAMLSQEEREEVTASSSDLVFSPSTFNFMQKVAEYMYMRFGFSWKPKSTANLFSNGVKISFRNAYREVFTPRESNPETTANFVMQYARNNTDSFLWKTLDSEEDANLYKFVSIKDDKKKKAIKALVLSHETPIFGIKLDDKLYILNPELSKIKGENIYVETTQLGIPNQFMEYNASEEGLEMQTVVTKENIEEQEEKVRISESAMAELVEEDELYDGEDDVVDDTSAASFSQTGAKRLESQEAISARDAVIEAIQEDEKAADFLRKKNVTAASFETTSVAKLNKLIDIINNSTSKRITKVKEAVKNLEKYC